MALIERSPEVRQRPRAARHVAIITQNAPPVHCGIGDHSLQLAAALRAPGYPATVIARKGAPDDGLEIVAGALGPDWSAAVEARIEQVGADHVILQYTPLMFSKGDWRIERELLRCWRSLAARRRASLIVHETYFRVFRRPRSLLRGTLEKASLRNLALASHDVFTASQPLRDEMSTWRLVRDPILLPIGSNVPLTQADPASLRARYGVGDDEIVLTLFSGGNSLKWSAGLVDETEAALSQAGITHSWLLLGGIPSDWFELGARVLAPGWLSPADLSMHLRMTDISLMPHVSGLSAKRGTLMAALQHGLPVVGTKGPITDGFWTDTPGVTLVDASDGAGFAAAVLSLSRDRASLRRLGRLNEKTFQQRFAWPRIANTLVDAIGTD